MGMNKAFAPFNRDVPILGQPFEIRAHYPTVILQCKCAPEQVIVIIGVQHPVQCTGCGKAYAILNEMQVRVGVGVPQGGKPS